MAAEIKFPREGGGHCKCPPAKSLEGGCSGRCPPATRASQEVIVSDSVIALALKEQPTNTAESLTQVIV